MKFRVLLIILLALNFCFGQYSRIEIDLSTTSMFQLMKLDLDTDHPTFNSKNSVILELPDSDLKKLEAFDIKYAVLVSDLEKFYVEQIKSKSILPRAIESNNCQNTPNIITPSNFRLGAMSGYFQYEEFLSITDSMVLLYPHLITKDSLSENSYEDRPIYHFIIADSIDTSNSEPKILFDALHHAREAATLSSTLYFMWYLLENYETDAEVKYLIDSCQIHFVPCINPDGYIHNQTTNPEGGGLWRKNRRLNNNGSFGVDLNRNYGYKWGYNSSGSSASPQSGTYRGESAFSEPETRAIRDLCIQEGFDIAMNYHSYGNLLIFPWGYESDFFTPDSATFMDISRWMTLNNSFIYGTGNQTVGYVTNGDSDDWMYGEQSDKKKIFSMTPELGSSQYKFWPPSNQIIPICKDALIQNIRAIHMLHNYLNVETQQDAYYSLSDSFLRFSYTFYGIDSSKPATIVFSTTENSNFISDTFYIENLENGLPIVDSVALKFSIEDTNSTLNYTITVSHNNYTYTKDASVEMRPYQILFNDSADDHSNWLSENGDWGQSDGHFLSNKSTNFYTNNTTSRLVLDQEISLAHAKEAYLEIDLEWDMEDNFDYFQIEASNDGFSWEPLCGKFSRIGTEEQKSEMLYDGKSKIQFHEVLSLEDYLLDDIYIKFHFDSDNKGTRTGVKIDNIRIVALTDSTIGFEEKEDLHFNVAYPNPTSDFVQIDYNLENFNTSELVLSNSLGQIIERIQLENNSGSLNIHLNQYSKGVYFYYFETENDRTNTRKIILR